MLIPAGLVGLVLLVSPPSATPFVPAVRWQGAVIGQSFAELTAAYPSAKPSGSAAAQTLELGKLDYSGVTWSKVALAFDQARRLDHVTFTIHNVDYDALKARLDAALDANPTLGNGIQVANASPYDMEMRICQLDDGEIDVTFERSHYDA